MPSSQGSQEEGKPLSEASRYQNMSGLCFHSLRKCVSEETLFPSCSREVVRNSLSGSGKPGASPMGEGPEASLAIERIGAERETQKAGETPKSRHGARKMGQGPVAQMHVDSTLVFLGPPSTWQCFSVP